MRDFPLGPGSAGSVESGQPEVAKHLVPVDVAAQRTAEVNEAGQAVTAAAKLHDGDCLVSAIRAFGPNAHRREVAHERFPTHGDRRPCAGGGVFGHSAGDAWAAGIAGRLPVMVLLGLLCMLVPAGVGGWVAWQNRAAVVHVQVGSFVWDGHLYAVLVVGALLACWFVLGAAFIQCRIAERRRARAGKSAPVTQESRPQQQPPQRVPARRSAPGRPAGAGAVHRAASPG